MIVQDICTGTGSSSPTNFALNGTTLFLTATDATHPSRLWDLVPGATK